MGTFHVKRSTLILLAIAAALVFWYMVHRSKQAQQTQDTTTGSTGSNLNSIAPELVGGSTGPSIGPVLSTPIDITITSSSPNNSANPIGNIQPVQPQNQMIGIPQPSPSSQGFHRPMPQPGQMPWQQPASQQPAQGG